jgi:hypothetical protein
MPDNIDPPPDLARWGLIVTVGVLAALVGFIVAVVLI